VKFKPWTLGARNDGLPKIADTETRNNYFFILTGILPMKRQVRSTGLLQHHQDTYRNVFGGRMQKSVPLCQQTGVLCQRRETGVTWPVQRHDVALRLILWTENFVIYLQYTVRGSMEVTLWHQQSAQTGRLERELKMLQLSASRCSCIDILWVSLVSFAAITLCVASQRVFIVVYFVIESVPKLLIYSRIINCVLIWCTVTLRPISH
jgi:hypothetical protein